MNKQIRNVLIVVSTIVGAYFIFVNYGDKNKINNSQTEDINTIRIGILGPMTGEGARYGEAMKWGIELAIDDINKNSKINYQTFYQDTKFSAKDAISGFKYLTSVNNVNVILGPAASGISKTIAPFSNKSKVVTISSISTADTLKFAGDYYFRNVSPNSNQAKTIADYISNKTDYKNVSVLYENNEYGLNMKSVFNSYYKSKGGEIVFEESYEFGQKDFRNLIVKLKKTNPEIVFIPGTTWGISILIKQLRESGVKSLIMTGDGGYGEDINKISGEYANGLICTLMSVEDTTAANYKVFKNKFLRNYNREPDVYSIYSYDAMFLIYNSISSVVQPITGEKIKNALYKVEYSGISGAYKFDEFGEVDKPFGLFEFRNGVYKQID